MAERAEEARLDLVRRQREAAKRLAGARRQTALLASAASVVMLGGILATAFVVVDFTPAAPARPQSPVVLPSAATMAFVATRKAVIRFAESSERQCRQVEFSNESGRFSNETQVNCNDQPEPVSQCRESPTGSKRYATRSRSSDAMPNAARWRPPTSRVRGAGNAL